MLGILTPRHRVTWTEGGKRRERVITLDWKGDPEELDRLYWACERGRHPKQKPPAPATSWNALIGAWRADPKIQKDLRASTKASYRRHMEILLEKNGEKDVRDTTRQHVRAIHQKLADTPRKADHMVQVISLLWNYAKNELDWNIGDNPAARISLYGPQREFLPWPEWMIDLLSSAPLDVQITAELILGTGQRPNAAISMRRSDFDGEWMWVLDEKGGQRFAIYCPERLRRFVAGLPKRGLHLLAKNLTETKGYDAVEKQFSKWRATLGERAAPFSLHGLRKLAIIELAEAGCSDAQIQSVTGQSARMVAFYRAKADKRTLSKQAMLKRDRNRNET